MKIKINMYNFFKKNEFSKKKVFLSCLISIISFFLLIISLSFFLKWYKGWITFMDDGPFHGEKRINCPITKPDQETVIWNNLKLKVYDKKKNEKAPTVLLQNKQGKILWCIYAIGYKETNITKIRFYRHKGFPFIISRVEGIVNWTYGTEATTWFISRDGKLEEYWYSW